MKNSTIDRPTLLIWDDEGHPPKGDWITVFWRSFGKGDYPAGISIPKLIDEQCDALRSRYLAWIYDLGETNINGKRLVDQLILRKGFSYWWMTLLAEKSYYKSPRLYDTVRLLALEELINKLQPVKIILVGSDQKVASILGHCCQKAGIDFKWRQSEQKSIQISLIKRLYRSLPYHIQAVSFLMRYIWKRWPLKQNVKDMGVSFASEITFVDYLIHLNSSVLKTGRFASNYWTELIRVFDQAKTSINWIHLFVQHEIVPTSRQARDLIARFNDNGSGLESHAMLDAALNLSLVFAALRDYVRLFWYSSRLRKIRYSFLPAGSNLDLWPLFKRDWLDSMRGSTAMWNCLVINLFEKTLNLMPKQKLGVYLQENQGWEVAFINAWRSAGHGHLIGVPHSTVRYWDLRYFSGPMSYRCTGKNDLPLPDQVALNGPVAIKAYREGGYPANQMVEVEALRFLNLTDTDSSKTQNTDLSPALSVLVCGDIMSDVSQQMMRWLVSAACDLPSTTRYIIKPHPACAILARNYPSMKLHLTNEPIKELLLKCDVAFTSNNTSAAVDAYCSGIPVVQVLDGNTFDMSPLRGLNGVVYVTNPSELADALRDARQRDRVIAEPYFFMDNELPRWQKLLGLRASL